jgi:hypothetical protein
MRGYLVILGLCAMAALAPTLVDAQNDNCITPLDATESVCSGSGTTSASPVSASEPLTLGITGLALLGAGMLRRCR